MYLGLNLASTVFIIDFVRLPNGLCAGIVCMQAFRWSVADIKQSDMWVFSRIYFPLPQYHFGNVHSSFHSTIFV